MFADFKFVYNSTKCKTKLDIELIDVCALWDGTIQGVPVPDQWGRYAHEGRVKWLGIRIDNNKVFEVDM